MIALEHAFPSDFEQAQAAGKPAPPGPGQAKSRDIVPDIGYNIHDIGICDTISDTKMKRYRHMYADIGILWYCADIGVYPISGIPDIGKRRYRETPISENADIGIF